MKKLMALLNLLIFAGCIFGQNTIGLPDIVNYSKHTYKAGSQNRLIRQDARGLLYFANNEGVLTYDGTNWKCYPLPNRSIVRSIEFGPDKNLYVGGQDEFGYFSPGKNGQLVYHSLKPRIPEKDRSFTDVWKIVFNKGAVFFQTSEKIYQINGKQVQAYPSGHWRFMAQVDNQVVAQEATKGLLKYENGVWKPFLPQAALPTDCFISSLTKIGSDSALITTVKHGIFLLANQKITRFTTPAIDKLADHHISASAMVNADHIIIATNLNGCFIIDKKGTLIRRFSRKEGLQNNNILDIYLDKEQNLWVGLENGIDFVAYNNAIKLITVDPDNEGTGYATAIHNGLLYTGTSNGLYYVKLHAQQDLSYILGKFSPVNGTSGQVWNLSQVNGQLLMGHHDGAFSIKNNQAYPIDKTTGFWTFLPFSNILPSSLVVAGTYQGISFYDYKNGSFQKNHLFANFESSRFVVRDNNNIWISHPYKGIFRVTSHNGKSEVVNYARQSGLLTVNDNYIFKIRNRLIATTPHGIYEYNSLTDKFEKSDYLNRIFGKKAIRYLKEDASGNIWFVFDKILGVVDFATRRPQTIYFPELTNKFVAGFEYINPIDKNNVLIGGENGFYHINYEQYKHLKYPLQVMINYVVASADKDSVLYAGYNKQVNEQLTAFEKDITVSSKWNSFQFSFSSPSYARQANIEYSYYLEGFEKEWGPYSRKSIKEYTNLPPGTYTFKVKAKNNLGSESAVSNYTFTISPPWYLSKWAYAAYLVIFIIINVLLFLFLKRMFKRQQRKHEEEQKRLQYLHQLELEKSEKELVKLRNEKLEAEIQHKNSELATTAMHLVQKGELLGKVKEQVFKLKIAKTNDENTTDLKKILRALNDEDKLDNQWDQFAMHFDKVHIDYLSVLKNKYPNITANELKLCAYLRLNLSTKEIAQLMNISVRGVEISRYRLRKKLGIPTEVALFDFLIEATSEKQA